MIVSGGTIWLGTKGGATQCGRHISIADEEGHAGETTMNDSGARALIQGHSGATTPNSTVYLSYWYNGSAATAAAPSESYNNRASYIRAGDAKGNTYQGDCFSWNNHPTTNPINVALTFSNSGVSSAYPSSTVFTWATGYSANITSYSVSGQTCSTFAKANGPNGGSFSYAIAHVGAEANTITSVDYAYTWNIQDNGSWDNTMIIPGKWNIACMQWVTGSGYTCSTTCGGTTYGNYSFTMPANSITIFTFDAAGVNSDSRSVTPLSLSAGVDMISGAEWWYNNASYWILWNTNSSVASGKFSYVYESTPGPYGSTGVRGVWSGHGGLRYTLVSST